MVCLPRAGFTTRCISVKIWSHSSRASSSPRMPYAMAAAAGAKAMPPSGGLPASVQPRRKRCASASASSKSPEIAATVSNHSTARWSASRKNGSSLRCWAWRRAASRSPAARYTIGAMCRVSEYSHAISTSLARGASRSKRRRTVATASSSSPQIRCTAVSWSSARLSRRASPTRWASSTARSASSAYAGSRSSATEGTVSMAASTWGSPPASTRASASSAHSSPGGSSSDMTPGAFVITSAAVASSTAARRGSPARRAASAAAR